MKVEFPATFEGVLKSGVNLFLGSGFSVLAKDKKGKPLPLGQGLGTELFNKFKECFKAENQSEYSLAMISQIISSQNKVGFENFLKERFSVSEFDSKYLNLQNVNIQNIVSTNIDNLIYKIYHDSRAHYVNDVYSCGPAIVDKAAIQYYPVHGSVISASSYTFTETEIASVFIRDQNRWGAILEKMKLFPTLFWGHSLSDSSVMTLVDFMKEDLQKNKLQVWIALSAEKEDSPKVEYLKSMGFKCLFVDTTGLLDYFSTLKTISAPKVRVADLPELKPYCIPKIGGRERPIKHFFMGSAPDWSDIYRDLHRIKYFSDVVEEINKHNHVAIIGMPACGKTTLLMQVAAYCDFKGNKFYIERLSPGLVQLILRNINTEPTIVFVDNFADQVDAFSELQAATNVLVVCAERDYNYDTALHKIRKAVKPIYINNISDSDMQGIYNSIPREIRAGSLVRPQIAEGNPPSVFEIIKENIKETILAERYQGALRAMRDKNYSIYELLVMAAYVHYCHTPISLDMLFSYINRQDIYWKDLYKLMEHLDPMIIYYIRPYNDVEDNQDFYTMRSFVYYDSIVRNIQKEDLAQVIQKFHENVSPYKICDYRIFKRRAFDADIISKAFTYESGTKFYEKIMSRDSSYYLKQQFALFCKKHKQYQAALKLIDEAKNESLGRVFSINNSYAEILFDANIGSPNVQDKPHLSESMMILERCYTQDRKKAYHAVRYAFQAVQYASRFNDEKRTEYLDKAEIWLREDMNTRFAQKTELLKKISQLKGVTK